MNKKIVLVSSGQPSLNPRLVKEADALTEAGYEVIVIYQYWNNWGTDIDSQLLSLKKWKAIWVGGSPKDHKTQYWFTRFQHKAGKLLAKFFGFNHGFAEIAIGRCTYQLSSEAKKHAADLYIAHNLAALPSVINAAKKNRAKCGFDAEDFHRNEVSDDPENFDVKVKVYLENKYFPSINYLSTSSPLISKEYKKLFSQLNPVTILNVFPKPAAVITTTSKSPLKLFWFSQTIGTERGIEEIIRAMGMYQEPVELHLLGNHDRPIMDYFGEISRQCQVNPQNIFYYKPILPEQIFLFATQFDIGMAVETGVPFNRAICLTNKLFTYIQSGLAVIASDTLAQQQFFQQYPQTGKVYKKGDPTSLAQLLKSYSENRDQLYQTRQDCIRIGQQILNWEEESKKLLAIIKGI